jgi:hypothetical protein
MPAAVISIIELCSSKGGYFHIVHPSQVPMALILQTLSTLLGIPIVPYSKWLGVLGATTSGGNLGTDNPAVHLLEFFISRQKDAEAINSAEALFCVSLDTTLTQAVAPSLGSETPLGPKDVEDWVAYWRRIGFLT